MISQRSGAGDWLLAAIAGSIGAVVGVAVGFVVVVAVGCFKLLALGAKRLGFVAQKAQATQAAGIVSDNSATEESTKPISAARNVRPESQWQRRYEGIERKRVDLGKNYVDIWFYPNLGIARRTMQIGNKKLASMFGPRLKLADIPLEDTNPREVELQTIKDAEKIIGEATKPKGPREIRPAKPVPSTGAPVSIPDTMQPELPLIEEPPSIEPETVQKAATEAMRQPRKREMTYRGRLVKQGVEDRPDRNNGGTYSCFCIHLDDFALNAVHDIVGTDLERALKEVNAKVGDAIEVSLAGETTNKVRGKLRTKKIWSITKIDQKS